MFPLGIALIVLGSAVSLLNWFTLVLSLRSDRFVSVVPLIGALLLGCGLGLFPQTRPFASLAVIADYGTLILIISLPRLAYSFWSTSRFNLICAFRTEDAGRRVRIAIYRRGIALIETLFDPPVPTGGGGFAVAISQMGTWQPIDGGYSLAGYAADRQLLIAHHNGTYRTRELQYPTGTEYNHDCMDGLTLHRS